MTDKEVIRLCALIGNSSVRMNMRITQLIANAVLDNGHPSDDLFYVSDEFLKESVERYIRLNG